LLSHDISDVLVCLDIRDYYDLPLYTLLKKTNLDWHMLHSLVRKSFPVATATAAVLSTKTQVLLSMVSVVNPDFLEKYHIFCKTQDFPANCQRCGKGPFRPDTTRPELGTLPWPSTCVLRRTTPKRDLVTSDCTVTDTDTLKIRYRLKRRLFSWRPLTGRPAWKDSWGRAIKISFKNFNCCRSRRT
jgi:hypothetical protein